MLFKTHNGSGGKSCGSGSGGEFGSCGGSNGLASGSGSKCCGSTDASGLSSGQSSGDLSVEAAAAVVYQNLR